MEPVPYDAESGFAKGSPSSHGSKPGSSDGTNLEKSHSTKLKASLSKAFLSAGMPVTFKVS